MIATAGSAVRRSAGGSGQPARPGRGGVGRGVGLGQVDLGRAALPRWRDPVLRRAAGHRRSRSARSGSLGAGVQRARRRVRCAPRARTDLRHRHPGAGPGAPARLPGRRPFRRAARGGRTDGHSGRGMPAPQCVSGRAGADACARRSVAGHPRGRCDHRRRGLGPGDHRLVGRPARGGAPGRRFCSRGAPGISAGRVGVRPADLPIPLGRRPSRLVGRGRRGRGGGRLLRGRADGSPHPDPAGGPGLGARPGAVGQPGRPRRPVPRAAPRLAG